MPDSIDPRTLIALGINTFGPALTADAQQAAAQAEAQRMGSLSAAGGFLPGTLGAGFRNYVATGLAIKQQEEKARQWAEAKQAEYIKQRQLSEIRQLQAYNAFLKEQDLKEARTARATETARWHDRLATNQADQLTIGRDRADSARISAEAARTRANKSSTGTGAGHVLYDSVSGDAVLVDSSGNRTALTGLTKSGVTPTQRIKAAENAQFMAPNIYENEWPTWTGEQRKAAITAVANQILTGQEPGDLSATPVGPSAPDSSPVAEVPASTMKKWGSFDPAKVLGPKWGFEIESPKK